MKIASPLGPNEGQGPIQQLSDDDVVQNSLFRTNEQCFQLDHPRVELQCDEVFQQISL